MICGTSIYEEVLSSIFRKFDSEKMKLCAGKPGEGAAKPRLIAAEHIPTAFVKGDRRVVHLDP